MNKIKVIIVGEAPYGGDVKAITGRAFAVKKNSKFPPSLKNIFKELENDLGISSKNHDGSLEAWVKQGVLLVNCNAQELELLVHPGPLVIMAWGNKAIKEVDQVGTYYKTLILKGGHPSPRNRTNSFFGEGYFSAANDWLALHGSDKLIDWNTK